MAPLEGVRLNRPRLLTDFPVRSCVSKEGIGEGAGRSFALGAGDVNDIEVIQPLWLPSSSAPRLQTMMR